MHDVFCIQCVAAVFAPLQQRTEATLLKSEGSLRKLLSPFYSELFSIIARLEGGIKFLVDIRGDLLVCTCVPAFVLCGCAHVLVHDVIYDDQLINYILCFAQDTAKSLHSVGTPVHLLTEMSEYLRGVLSHWFTPQLMDLQQITWESPCDILEKISLYEAVHPLRHWKDLKHRVGENRRCFIFTHKAISREPIMVLHVALTDEPSSSIQVCENKIHTHVSTNICINYD